METPRQEVVKHQALAVWNKPNGFYTRQEFVESFQQHVDLCGESEWFVGRTEGLTFPTELWVVRPDKMEPIPSVENFLAGWVYTDPDNNKVPLELDEIIQVRMPDPNNAYRGKGPVASLLTDLNATELAAKWNSNFFRNSAIPGGVVQVPSSMSDKAFLRLQQQFREQHRGIANAHRTAILEEDAKWVNTQFSMKDMDFTALRGMSREIIREGFRYPKFMLGMVDDVNRATAQTSREYYDQNLIKPRLERIKQALNKDFLPLFGSTGEGVEFDYVLEEPEDPAEVNESRNSRVKAFVDLLSAGVDPEDAAMFCELPQMKMKEVQSVPAGA
jgi:HK97 family phage portal protein